MPILGGLINPQLARLGKIVIGEKGSVQKSSKGTEFRPPKKLDHFVVKTLYRDDGGQLVEDKSLMKRLGDKPRELRIRLPFNDLDANFVYDLRYYKGGMLFCHGSGQEAQRRKVMREQAGKPVYGQPEPFGPCGSSCPDFQNRNCRRFGALRVMLEEQQQVGGVYEFRTTGRHSIENILSGLLTVQRLTGGVLGWVPLLMKLVPQTVNMPDGGTTTVQVVQIVYDGPPQKLLTEVRDILALRAPMMQEIRALEAGMLETAEDDEEARDTQDEFYPEQSKAELEATNGHATEPKPAEQKPAQPTTDQRPGPRTHSSLTMEAGQLIRKMAPGDDKEAQFARKQLIQQCWDAPSWSKVALMDDEKIAAGLAKLKAMSGKTSESVDPDASEEDVPDFPAPPGDTIVDEEVPEVGGDGEDATPGESDGEDDSFIGAPEVTDQGFIAWGSVEEFKLWAEMMGYGPTLKEYMRICDKDESGTELMTLEQYAKWKGFILDAFYKAKELGAGPPPEPSADPDQPPLDMY